MVAHDVVIPSVQVTMFLSVLKPTHYYINFYRGCIVEVKKRGCKHSYYFGEPMNALVLAWVPCATLMWLIHRENIMKPGFVDYETHLNHSTSFALIAGATAIVGLVGLIL